MPPELDPLVAFNFTIITRLFAEHRNRIQHRRREVQSLFIVTIAIKMIFVAVSAIRHLHSNSTVGRIQCFSEHLWTWIPVDKTHVVLEISLASLSYLTLPSPQCSQGRTTAGCLAARTGGLKTNNASSSLRDRERRSHVLFTAPEILPRSGRSFSREREGTQLTQHAF